MSTRLLPWPRRAAPRQVAWPLRGPRSIFAKGLRDSRRATLLAGLGMGIMALFLGVILARQFPTAADREQILVGGALAFALAPILGRAAAAGIASGTLIAAYVVNAYAGVIPAFDQAKGLSWFTWSANQRPLAGRWDAASLIPIGVLVVALFAVGIVAFERRDIGATVRLPRLRLPGARLARRGPARQAFMSRIPASVAWGIAIGFWALLVAMASRSMGEMFLSSPGAAGMLDLLFRDVPWQSAGGMLQLFFFSFAILIIGLATAALVSGVAAEERERRLELLLSTPVSRARLTIANGVGLFGAIAVVTLVIAASVAVGAAASGDDPVQPFLGAWVSGLYAGGLAGVGLAVIGLGAIDAGAPATAALALGFFLWDFIGSAVRLPPEWLDLSLTRHLGQPMVGRYDWPGMLLLATLAIGGLALGAWGMGRRDVLA